MAKTALGAENWVAWEYQNSPSRLVKKLKAQGVKIVALETGVKSIAISKFKPKFPLALVLGEEVRGVSKSILKLCNQIVKIPMHGKKESLNVSVAFGIAAFYVKN